MAVDRVGEMMDGNDHNMPEQGKYNGGQKAMFWAMSVCMLLLFVSGIILWRAYFSFPVDVVRLGAVVHAAAPRS
jgi:formate dehydrogenase subunit gamma